MSNFKIKKKKQEKLEYRDSTTLDKKHKEQSNLFRLFLSLQIPVLMHGFYNLTTYSNQFISVVIIFVVVSITIIVIQRNKQKYKLWEQETIFKHSNTEYLKSIFFVLIATILICLVLAKVL